MNLHPPRLPFDPDGCLYGQQRIPARRVVQLIGTEQSCRAEGADTQDGLTVCVSVCRGGGQLSVIDPKPEMRPCASRPSSLGQLRPSGSLMAAAGAGLLQSGALGR